MKAARKGAIVFAASRGFAFTSTRLPLLTHFIERDFRVVVAAARDRHFPTLDRLGVVTVDVPFRRGGLAPLADLAAYRALSRLYRAERPALIQHFHAKPIIQGGSAARRRPCGPVVNTVTGLGAAFVAGGFTRWLAGVGYRHALRDSAMTVFQNPADRNLFLDQGWVDTAHSAEIAGDGVDLDRFRPGQRAIGERDTVLMSARLLWQKGVREFIASAEKLSARHPRVRFVLAGELDRGHQGAVPLAYIEAAAARGAISYAGFVDEPARLFADARMLVLPTTYGEGLPRVLQEAAAAGIPVVTSDVPGCRAAVTNGDTGLVVKAGDGAALTRAIARLLADDELASRLGANGRARAEREFDLRRTTAQQIEIYRHLGVDIEPMPLP